MNYLIPVMIIGAPPDLNQAKRLYMDIRVPRFVPLLFLLPLLAASTFAYSAQSKTSSEEARTARYFESIRTNPNLLLAFLREMPKGGDLHNHLSGEVYAESLIDWAAEAGDCVDAKTTTLSRGPCTPPLRPAAEAFLDPGLYNQMIDAFSMRNWQYSGQSGHDHFFDTFGKFSQATQGTTDRMLAEAASRAASQREVYQELMVTLAGAEVDALAVSQGWDPDFGSLEQKLISHGLPQILKAASGQLRTDEDARDKLLHCGWRDADPGCQIGQRFLYQVARGKPKEMVFAEILAGFLLSGGDPTIVPPDPHVLGLNLVMPEDWYVPMKDFTLHMQMLDYLHQRYPRVHITLHAGELWQGLVPPEGLRFHIRESVETGHAERIGHGIDVMYETNPSQLLHEMADRKVMVEICLTSNAEILGVSGTKHPLSEYIRAGVPVALATDDEGVARSDMTHEYLRGAEDQKLSYLQLKKMARTSLEYAFLPGVSLWRDNKNFVMAKACAADVPGTKTPSAACQAVLDTSDKAHLQWELEVQFREFESRSWTSAGTAAKKSSPARRE